MAGWTFAQGKSAEQTLDDVTLAGATQIALAGADAIFAVGERLFTSEADGSEAEHLGRVTAVDSAAVDFSLPLKKSKDSGALIWRATTSIALYAEESAPPRRRIATGVDVARSLGGVVYAIRTAEPMTTLEWTLENLTPEREAALAAWLDAATQGGLAPFTAVDPARTLSAVQLWDGAFARLGERGGRRAMKFALLLLGEGEYR
jgi:hypothetical protein